jgi:hypothetical protein
MFLTDQSNQCLISLRVEICVGTSGIKNNIQVSHTSLPSSENKFSWSCRVMFSSDTNNKEDLNQDIS